MSKKRTSTESSHDEQTTKDSHGELMQAVLKHEEEITKRARLAFLSYTKTINLKLEDLPNALLECILVKAVAMEVKDITMDKSLWREVAETVISRLTTVSMQWSNILLTDFFRKQLRRTLDGFAEETMRWKIMLQPSIQSYVMKLTSMRDEVFMICVEIGGGCYVLTVYDLNNMARPKDIIPLSGIYIGELAACSIFNCVYLLDTNCRGPSVLRIARNAAQQIKLSVWIKNLNLPVYDMGPISVAANGNLIILSRQPIPKPTVVGIYDANGVMKREIMLSPDLYEFSYVSSVIQKANGNLAVVAGDDRNRAKLLEIKMSGKIARKYKSPSSNFQVDGAQSFEDIYGRTLVNYPGDRIELLDSKFNLLDASVPQLASGQRSLYKMHYNSDRHEMICVHFDCSTNTSALVSFRFTEE